MKKQYLLAMVVTGFLLSYGTTPLQGALEPKKAWLEVTQHHLTRIIFRRGLSFFVFKSEGERAAIFKNNVTKSVAQATKKLFEALIKQASPDTIASCLRSGADAQAHIIFEHQGNSFSVTPALIITALEHPASEEIFKEIERADSRITQGIDEIASNEPEIGDLFQKIMAEIPPFDDSALPLTPPESPQEPKALFKTTPPDLTPHELQTLLLSLRI